MKVAVTGSSGLIGTALVASLRADGHEVMRLVRRAPRAADEIRWDPRAADGGMIAPAAGGLAGIDACVHLAGAGIADHRLTARYKAEVRASRVLGTRALAGALAKLSPPPATLVAASAIGWYGDTGGREVDESAPAGQSFLARLVRDWEAAAGPAADAGIRVVHPRSALVLTPRGGMLARMLPLARLGLLPRFASGRQVMSWISLSDEIAAVRFLLDRKDISGPVNLTAPAPVTNAEFTAALTAAVGRRDLPFLRVPASVLRLALGEAAIELLTSTRVRPGRLLEAGYEFRYPALPETLAAELASAERHRHVLARARSSALAGVLRLLCVSRSPQRIALANCPLSERVLRRGAEPSGGGTRFASEANYMHDPALAGLDDADDLVAVSK
jgi:uncharacterized protein (TIGR01777 family)